MEDEETIGRDTKITDARLEKFKQPEFVFVIYDTEARYPSIDLKDAYNTLKLEVTHYNGIDNSVNLKLLKIFMRNNQATASKKI